jgi:redox-sensitive bicupin YhaK (pirin superfamily)
VDPFLFCAHHDDAYPSGNEQMGPNASLNGRHMGMDFEGIDGWRMYHGDVVPGFPRHPHRGFETLTLARQGFIDHSDSLGATARFGHGDAQWMTAGKGIVHSEMFPLVERDAANPTELFQIWIYLPQRDKFVEPHFSMLWAETIPKPEFVDPSGKATLVAVVAGELDGHRGPTPPPDSWASKPDSDVNVWTIRMDAGARFTLPAGRSGSNRTLYLFRGKGVTLDGERLDAPRGIVVRPDAALDIEAGPETTELLMLHGRPISERVVQYGPFVMNEPREIQEAMRDYQRTQFGGWPWPSDGPVHARDRGRFAIHADGRSESADAAE